MHPGSRPVLAHETCSKAPFLQLSSRTVTEPIQESVFIVDFYTHAPVETTMNQICTVGYTFRLWNDFNTNL
ncbi:hypothetical protein ACHAXS_003140 [Conticribra weissflogii]